MSQICATILSNQICEDIGVGSQVGLSGNTAKASGQSQYTPDLVQVFTPGTVVGTWQEEACLTVDDGAGGVYNYPSISVDGDTLAVCMLERLCDLSLGYCAFSSTNPIATKAFIFFRTGTMWGQQA